MLGANGGLTNRLRRCPREREPSSILLAAGLLGFGVIARFPTWEGKRTTLSEAAIDDRLGEGPLSPARKWYAATDCHRHEASQRTPSSGI